MQHHLHALFPAIDGMPMETAQTPQSPPLCSLSPIKHFLGRPCSTWGCRGGGSAWSACTCNRSCTMAQRISPVEEDSCSQRTKKKGGRWSHGFSTIMGDKQSMQRMWESPVWLGVEDAGEAYCVWKRNNCSGGPHDPADRVCRHVLCSASSLLYQEKWFVQQGDTAGINGTPMGTT